MNDTSRAALNEKLTLGEMEIIRATWKKMEHSIEMAVDFYNRLFYLYPFLRPLFKENIQVQARKFSVQISLVVNNIDNVNSLKPQLEELGKRHDTYEVKSQHYTYVREALFYALKSHLGNEWSESTESAWVKFYQFVANQMMHCPHSRQRPAEIVMRSGNGLRV